MRASHLVAWSDGDTTRDIAGRPKEVTHPEVPGTVVHHDRDAAVRPESGSFFPPRRVRAPWLEKQCMAEAGTAGRRLRPELTSDRLPLISVARAYLKEGVGAFNFVGGALSSRNFITGRPGSWWR